VAASEFEAAARRFGLRVAAWYQSTPPADRATWGGLAAAAALGLGVAAERALRLRRLRIIPADFAARFLERLQDGRIDRGKALDYCELNTSPASRVALAAVRRWGRSAADLERAVSLAHRVEAEHLRRGVATLRRIAALSPLIGLLGTLFSVSRALSELGPDAGAAAWGPAIASALAPLTAGVALATLALVAYDGLAARADSLAGALDRVGAETVDGIAMALPPEPASRPTPHAGSSPTGGPARTPHQVRLEVPRPTQRAVIDDDSDADFD
jgi:biopolymer transport protein ExbB